MKCTLVGLASAMALFAVELQAPPADACGVKLIVKTPNPRQAVTRSAHPSKVLLIGTPPNKLRRDLSAKGHTVEVAADASSAKRDSYNVVLTDAAHESEARARFGDSVVVRSGDVAADVRSVEQQVARRPVRTDADRPVVAAKPDRKPIAAGPERSDAKVVVATKPATPTPAVAPTPPDESPADTTPQRISSEPAPAVTEAPAEAPKKVVKATKLHEEVYFSTGKAELHRSQALARAVKWLNANPDAIALIEGHADPRGSEEANMALSQSRAEAVRDFLVQAGIDASRLEVEAFGETRLKYGPADSRNRRVEIKRK